MGGSAATHNNFWELFGRPAGSTGWALATPPGMASNGGLVMDSTGASSLVAGFRPSQYLRFSPLAATHDAGRTWSSLPPLGASLSVVPDALASAPTGPALALLSSGDVDMASSVTGRWTTLTGLRSLAATAAGRKCALRGLTAVTFGASGEPLLAGACGHPGTVGVFAHQGQSWQAAGPTLPPALAGEPVTVIRLSRDDTATAARLVALLVAGSGHSASLLAAWSTGTSGQWTLSSPLPLTTMAPKGSGQNTANASAQPLAATGFGVGGWAAVMRSGGHGETIAGPGAPWRPLPTLPTGTATLAPGPAGGCDALAVQRARLTVWQLGAGATAWRQAQAINVPIQYGSSG